MKKITQTIILIGAVLMVLFTACSKKGNVGPAGPQGSQGNTGDASIITDGYIKGTVNGIREDGTAFVKGFTFTSSFNVSQSSMDSISPTSYDFTINKGDMDHPITEFGSQIEFNASSLSPLTITTASFRMVFSQITGANQFVFATNTGIIPTFSNLVYDKTTGVITGNYIANINGSQNTTGNFANVTGSFKATIAQIYHREIKNSNQLNLK
jgi:hypothetical protein